MYSRYPNRVRGLLAVLTLSMMLFSAGGTAQKQDAVAQEEVPQEAASPVEKTEELAVPEAVNTIPTASDMDIAARLQQILESTNWYGEPGVRVEDGVVFLTGTTAQPEYREWARQLALRTQDVVAVVNNISVTVGSMWELGPAWQELRRMGRSIVRQLPIYGIALIILLVFLVLALIAARVTRRVLERRAANQLLLGVASKLVLFVVLLVGLYIALQVTGFDAVTMLGGTGILGLVLGIAFRDIAENFLASLLLSVQQPFKTGDLIEVEGMQGYVQRVTARSTVIMAFNGNYIQVPNATIYKSTIRNLTANSKMRLDFQVGIGYDTKIAQAQEVGLAVLKEHPAVLQEPEPMILTEELAATSVNLRVYFWIDLAQHSSLRVKAAIMRLIVTRYQEEGISMPGELREVIFPEGVPVRLLEKGEAYPPVSPTEAPPEAPEEGAHTASEGNLNTESHELRQQVADSTPPEEGENLLARPAEEPGKS
jgi:small conductance mechanosensitive channel